MTTTDAEEPRADAAPGALAAPGAARRLSHDYSDEACFANMAMLWRHYGRPPRFDDANRPPSTVRAYAYLRRCGTWRKARAAFAAFCGIELGRTGPARAGGPAMVPGRAPVERARKAPLGLRFQVLTRDRFKCVVCGASPAADPACKLHVDHIEPLSRGGKTELGNLRTLCAACNLGRGAKGEG